MKELSIEEKAKAYDEALEKAKMVLQERGNEPDGAALLSKLFPHLKESDDERIRKAIKLMYSFLPNEPTYIGDVPVKDIFAWLEKQGEHAKFRDSIQVGDKVTRNQDGVLVNLSQLKRVVKKDEKQGEQKPVDKIEPKFHEGDWIINRTDATIMQIVNNKDFYESVEIGGQRRTDTYNYIEWDFRLWTIQDAKDGDVLIASDKSLFIFDGSINENGSEGFHIAFTEDIGIILNSDDGCGWEEKNSCHPATKKQRDLLFQKMKEAGYEWDAEKKELKKIEQNHAWSEEDETYLNTIVSDLDYSKAIHNKAKCKFIDKEIKWFKSLKDRVIPQSKQEWSGEDEGYYDAIISKLEVTQEDALLTDNEMDFLKSLKDRVQPKQEWNEEDKEMYKKVETAINSYYAPFSRDAEEMSEWFKNLKYRVQP